MKNRTKILILVKLFSFFCVKVFITTKNASNIVYQMIKLIINTYAKHVTPLAKGTELTFRANFLLVQAIFTKKYIN